MHRSGTSFLARALNLAGVYLGGLGSLTSNEWKYNDDNIRGHWENKKFLELGEKTLSQNNGHWSDVPTQILISEELGKEITNCSEELMNHPSLASGFKDLFIWATFASQKLYNDIDAFNFLEQHAKFYYQASKFYNFIPHTNWQSLPELFLIS